MAILNDPADAAAGDALVAVKRTETGAVATTQHVINQKLPLHIEAHFAAAGDGVTVDNTAFASAAAAGREIHLRDGATYLLSTRVSPVTGTRFRCPGGVATIRFVTGASGFNSTDLTADKDAAARCGFLFLSVDDIGMEGIRFTTDAANERVIYPIRVRGGTATKGCRFERLEFVGFAVCNGAFLSLNSIGVGSYVVKDITARSCGTSSTSWTGTPQLTVVEIDNDMVASTPSEPGRIGNIRGYDIALTGSALSTYGQQTDVLNVAGISGTDRKGPEVVGVYGDNVGEVLDVFGSYGIYRGIRGRNVYNYVVKLIHGAQYNDVEIEAVESVGVAAVGLFGSSALAVNTQYNNVRMGVCRILTDVGAAGLASVVLFGDNGGGGATCLPKNNTVRVDNVHVAAAGCDYVVRDGGADNNNANFVEIGRVTGTWATNFCDCVPDNVTVRYRQNPRTRMTVGAAQTLTTTVAATVQYNTIATGDDTDGGGDTTNFRVRPRFPGLKHVKGQIRLALNADDDVTIRIQKNGVTIAQAAHEATSSGLEHTYAVDRYVYVAEDECGKAASDLTIQATVASAGAISVMNTATMSYFEVTDVG